MMGNGRNSAFGRSLAPRLVILLAGASLVLAACSTEEKADAPGPDNGSPDYASGTVQVREFKDRTGEFAALAFAGSDFESVGSGVLSDDGKFSWSLDVPPQTALENAASIFGEGVSSDPDTVGISLIQEFYDESTEQHIDHAVMMGTSSGLDEFESGTRAGYLIYSEADTTLEFASEHEEGTVELHEGWNVLAYEILQIDSDGMAHARLEAGTAADLYFYHYYHDWAEAE